MSKKSKNKLPSGNYRVQVYDFTDEAGKKHYRSFTAPSKKQAQALAADWKAKRELAPAETDDISVSEAVQKYIALKENVLSPSTIRAYKSISKTHFTNDLGKKRLSDLSNTALQLWISSLSAKVGPKTVRNAYGLLSSTLDMFYPEFCPKIQLPAKKRPELYCPSDEDIRKLLSHIKGTELEIAVLLAAFGPLRRGEICALTSDDIHGNFITINKSMVYGDDSLWHIKQPKTYGSYRTIEFPEIVINKLQGIEGNIVKANPTVISSRFRRSVASAGIPKFRFHDLRHYSASIMHAIGIPDQYILQRGGWATDNVMKSVYRNVIDLEAKKQDRKIIDHFTKLSM